jgi:hypothetical protein
MDECGLEQREADRAVKSATLLPEIRNKHRSP